MRALQILSLKFAFERSYRIYDTLKARTIKRPSIQNRRSFDGAGK